MKSKLITLSVLLLFSANTFAQDTRLTDYVDPRIGSEGLGRVFIGPSCPYGMVKPSPDCTPRPNSGWLPMPEQVDGFSQVHVSGTGGGPKYGNILVMPFGDGMDRTKHIDHRKYETIKLGYYTTQFQASGIQTEITTASKASFYRFTYPKDSLKSLAIDAGFFLGESPVPDAREAQQFVGSEIQIISDREVIGYTRIRGGWNNGRAYTVYFYAETDKPFVNTATWKGDKISFRRHTRRRVCAVLIFPLTEARVCRTAADRIILPLILKRQFHPGLRVLRCILAAKHRAFSPGTASRPVERKRDRVKDRRFACPRIARDQEQSRPRPFEINLRHAPIRAKRRHCKQLRFHTRSSSSASSTMRARIVSCSSVIGQWRTAS